MLIVMQYRDFLWACVGGILLGIGFVAPTLWWISLFAFAPFLHAILSSPVALFRRVFFLGFAFGYVAYGLSFYPSFLTARSISLAHVVEPWQYILIGVFLWSSTVLAFALSTGLFALIVRALHSSSWLDVPLVASAWPLADWLGAWIFSLANANEGVLYGPHFTLGSFGYLLAADTALVQVSWLGGLFALNAFIALCGAILFHLWATQSFHERLALSILAALMLILWVGGHATLSRMEVGARSPEALTIAAINTQETIRSVLSEKEFDARVARVFELLQSVRDADVILIPEGRGVLEQIRREHGLLSGFLDASFAERADGPVVIDSVHVDEFDGTRRSRIEYRNVGTRRSSFAYKQQLFPYAETVPGVYIRIADALGLRELFAEAFEEARLQSGEPQEPVPVKSSIRASALLCSDGVSPLLYRNQAAKGAQVFFNLSSQAVYEGSYLMDELTARIASARAVESRRWFVLSGNVVSSFAIDPYGRQVATTEKGEDGVLYVEVNPRNDVTPFVRFGEGVLLVPLLIVGALTARRFVDHTKKWW